MSNSVRRNRKADNNSIIRLNSIGLSLATIGERFNCHPTSITLRLKSLNIKAADTRRAFMEDIYQAMPVDAQEIVADILVPNDGTPPQSIKDFMRGLLVAALEQHQAGIAAKAAFDNDNIPDLTGLEASTLLTTQEPTEDVLSA